MNNYFPLDVALEGAFFDREKERKRLKHNMLSCTHTLVTSPRRYGKTSLVLRAMAELENITYAQMDMMLASNEERMKNIILDGIGRVTAELTSGKTKVLELAKKIFLPFGTIESIEFGKLTIRFSSYTMNKPVSYILFEALQRLELLASQLNKTVILFFDEYQYLLEIKNSLEFESALRSFAQTSKHIVCIFSGSNRHLLQEVFSDRSRPFYNMCDHLFLERISAEDYTLHLYELSKKHWKKKLTEEVLQFILELTACHSYYVNALCRRLWQLSTLPQMTDVLQEWKTLASEKRYEISSDLEKITALQRTILIELAHEPFSQPTSIDVVKKLNASVSGISHALQGLIEKDYVYQDDKGIYRVLNPLMAYVLSL